MRVKSFKVESTVEYEFRKYEAREGAGHCEGKQRSWDIRQCEGMDRKQLTRVMQVKT